MCSHLTADTNDEKVSEEKGVFSIDVAKSIGYPYKKMNLDLYFTIHRKINSRWFENLSNQHFKFLQKNNFTVPGWRKV